MNAALRFGVAHLRRLRRAVYTVMRLGKSHPDHADGIVGPRRDVRLRVVGLGGVDERRIVSEHRIADFGRDLEHAYGNRVSRTTEADWKLRNQPARVIDSLQSPLGLEKH